MKQYNNFTLVGHLKSHSSNGEFFKLEVNNDTIIIEADPNLAKIIPTIQLGSLVGVRGKICSDFASVRLLATKMTLITKEEYRND